MTLNITYFDITIWILENCGQGRQVKDTPVAALAIVDA